MSIVVTVEIPAAPAIVRKAEQDHPEVMEPLGALAVEYVTGHQRLLGEDRVMDVLEFRSKAAFDEFMAAAGELTRRHGELIGASKIESLWTLDGSAPAA